ncbi:MAG: transposase [Candidatus Omnitrophica bacterium]|nr:transposase [Candidatus Omnitrophota bacterium]
MKPKRVVLDGAVYHITVRGNQKQKTFLEEVDFLNYFKILRHYKKKYRFKLYAYCLMPNHVHLILEVENSKNLSKIMQGINLSYTIYFNKKYQKVGHLWQGRYKSKIIQKDKYLIDCIEYVELNPVRSGLVENPFDYPWSSWRERFGKENKHLIDTPQLI